ncbi:4-(cytidine 5'-diphospho)-2-C-methyl-D-erythritol kinase [Cellulomonas sp. PhB143]|uniref:4-(cytidine 5'-diphospho)-2-C-methyl-D-erythritol kinase n=1 Tax=Cellulomonas sp. PhB143 TaxID=2485186 RepID=UPI000F46D50D|nr:4-(cytidine 5'-diphospho)-2-C-methyl-D-erythritol kinase [Cellulomonas sp. PhB143]ROS78702.1 4-diphosphocytidyl-2-C-methyl-D-erythritol kinase [Cellulomonas sp. PhB143]
MSVAGRRGPLAPVPAPSVLVRAPGKVNLSLRVGRVQDDGYHPIVTVFQAVGLFEEVRVTVAEPGAGISLAVRGPHADVVPTGEENLAWRAAALLAERTGIAADVRIEIAKGVPVGGGMAGGSADAAATLLACETLWSAGVAREDLLELAGELGSDVPFGLLGHTAVGTGRGHLLTPAMTRGELHWAFAVRDEGLSTAGVYAAFDARAGGRDDVSPDDDAGLLAALRAGDAEAVGRALHNDLEEASLDLAPHLAETVALAERAGAAGVVVSGSGPTVAALGRNRQHALALADAWAAAGVADSVHHAAGPVHGARVVTQVSRARD